MPEFQSFDPRTSKPRTERPDASSAEIEQALAATHAVHVNWRLTPLSERSAVLRSIAEVLERRAEPLGALMAAEMGKPLTQGIGEARKCAWA